MPQIPWFYIKEIIKNTGEKYTAVSGVSYNGFPGTEKKALLLPYVKEIRIKDNRAGARQELRLKGIPVKSINAEDTLVPFSFPVQLGRKALVYSPETVSTDSCLMEIPYLPGRKYVCSVKGRGSVLTIKADKALPLANGASVYLTFNCKRTNIIPVTILGVGDVAREARTSLIQSLPAGTGEREVFATILENIGYCLFCSNLAEPAGSVKLGDFTILSEVFFNTLINKIKGQVNNSVGIDMQDLAVRLSLPITVVILTAEYLAEKGFLVKSGDLLIAPAEDRKKGLSPMTESILEEIKRAGVSGLSKAVYAKPPFSKVLESLILLKLVVTLGKTLVFTPEGLSEAITMVFRGKEKGALLYPEEISHILSISKTRGNEIHKYLRQKGFLNKAGDKWIITSKPDV